MKLIFLPVSQPTQPSKWLITNILCLILTFSFGQKIPEKPSPPRLVNDFSNLMTPQEQKELENTLVRYSDSTTTQITVVTLPTLDGLKLNLMGSNFFANGVSVRKKTMGF